MTKRGSRLAIAVALSGLAAAACAAPAAAAGQAVFRFSGHCTELQLGVPADDGALGALVPGPFVPLGSPAQPVVTLGVARCRESTANGRPIAPWAGSLAGTPIVPTGTGAAFERYWLWNVGGSRRLDNAFDRLGLRSALVRRIRLRLGASASGFRSARAVVPWRRSRYRLQGRLATAPEAPLAGSSVFWHEGPRGLVKVTYEISNGRVLSGTGRVDAGAGSPLARLVGPNPTGAAVLIVFDFESTAEIVG